MITKEKWKNLGGKAVPVLVLHHDFENNSVGTEPEPYKTKVHLQLLSDFYWKSLIVIQFT